MGGARRQTISRTLDYMGKQVRALAGSSYPVTILSGARSESAARELMILGGVQITCPCFISPWPE